MKRYGTLEGAMNKQEYFWLQKASPEIAQEKICHTKLEPLSHEEISANEFHACCWGCLLDKEHYQDLSPSGAEVKAPPLTL